MREWCKEEMVKGKLNYKERKEWEGQSEKRSGRNKRKMDGINKGFEQENTGME